MGKTGVGNTATNSSFSYTSDKFFSSIGLSESSVDSYVGDGLSSQEKERFINHLKYIKSYYGFSGCFDVSSKNNFPPSCGIASSASSFAALTLCACGAISNLTNRPFPSNDLLASLSRVGSGSSCRSFHGSWSLWKNDSVSALDFAGLKLDHFVVVICNKKKSVSSSGAHLRVSSSSLFIGRKNRAEERLQAMLLAIYNRNWRQVFDLMWAEFWDMHALFETSMPSFSYLKPGSIAVLNYIRDFWHQHGNGPLVTVDAGPNIHLFFRNDQVDIRDQILLELKKDFLVLG